MILEEDHIERDTAKYVKPLKLELYRDLVLRIGFIMKEHQDKMGLRDLATLKIAQATICQLGLEKELEITNKIVNELEGENDGI